MPPHFFRRNGTGRTDSPARRGAIPLRSPHGAATRRAESHGRAQPPRHRTRKDGTAGHRCHRNTGLQASRRTRKNGSAGRKGLRTDSGVLAQKHRRQRTATKKAARKQGKHPGYDEKKRRPILKKMHAKRQKEKDVSSRHILSQHLYRY